MSDTNVETGEQQLANSTAAADPWGAGVSSDAAPF